MNASRTTCWRCASLLCSAQARSQGTTTSAPALFSSLSHNGASSQGLEGLEGHRIRQAQNRRGGRARLSRQPPWGHHPPRGPNSRNHSPTESAIEIFNNVVNAGKHSPENGKPSSLLEEQEIVTRLRQLVEKRVTPLKKLEILEAEILPSLRGQSYGLPQSISAGLKQFLDQTCDDLVRSGGVEGSLQLSEMGTRLANFDLAWRNLLILNLCHGLLPQRKMDRDMTQRALTELIDLWRQISQMKRMSASRNGSRLRSAFSLPSNDEILRDIGPAYRASNAGASQSPSVLKAFTSLFPQFTPQEAHAILPGLILSVAVISDPRISGTADQIGAAPLLDRVATVLQQITADGSCFSDALRSDRTQFPASRLQDLEAYVAEQWPGVTAMLDQKDAPWREKLASSAATDGPAGVATSIDQVLPLLKKAFTRTKRTSPIIFSLWDEVKAGAEASKAFVREMHNNPEFLDEWILVLCAVKGGSKVQEALDMMQRVQLRPTVKTYTNMMHGWKICKDTNRIEALWTKLVKSGARLDAHIWTERISSLIELDPQAGIQALADMQALWKAAEERSAATGSTGTAAVQPSIEVVNAAFKGLITLDRKAALDVLAWAGREQIMPNVRTYNILLQQSLRSDPPDDIPGILRAMERQGIQPDEATFTLLLEQVLGGIAGEPAEAQVSAVQGAFEHMSAAGFRPNAMTYAKMLYALTDFASGGADEAVAAVIDHMRAHSVPVSAEVVTILLERAIRADPAGGLPAVRNILQQYGFTRIGHGDQTLWERVMSAHAVAGDAPGALAIFDDLSRIGRFVTSLPCLRNLLAALIAARRFDDGKRVVQTVLQQALKNVEGPGDTRYWQHNFWFMAREHAFFRLEDVPLQVRVWMEQRGSARMLA